MILKMFRDSTQPRQKEERSLSDATPTCKLPCQTHQTSFGRSYHLRLAQTQTHTSTHFFNAFVYFIAAIIPLVVESTSSSSHDPKITALTSRQRAFHQVEPPKHLACQLKDCIAGHICRTSLGMDWSSAQSEHVGRARQSWANGSINPDRMMPPAPKTFPTRYYLEQKELARPWVGPVPDWAVHHDSSPTHPRFQRGVLAIQAYLIIVASKATERSHQFAIRLWWLTQLIITWGVVFPVKRLVTSVGNLQWDLVTAAIVALWIARWLPGPEDEVPREAVKPDEPVYILMVPRGGRFSKWSNYEFLLYLLINLSDRASLSAREVKVQVVAAPCLLAV